MTDRLIGLNIDTNERKYEPVTDSNCEAVLEWLIETGKIHTLRRLGSGKTFTGYTYHGGNLGETLYEFLNFIE